MNRRIFLNEGSFNAASNIFTKIIWKKQAPARYRKAITGVPVEGQLSYELSVYPTGITEGPKAPGSENKVVLAVEVAGENRARKIRKHFLFSYQIQSSVIISKENILNEEITIYQVEAKLVSQGGELPLPEDLNPDLKFIIKPGLSATILGRKEIYLPFCGGDPDDEF